MKLQAFGRARKNGTKWEPHRDTLHCAAWILALGGISVSIFLAGCILHGRVADDFSESAVPVMAQLLQELPADGVPHGYLDGEWNLWEYLSDMLSSLFIGG